jgi:uncharacterized membrane protein
MESNMIVLGFEGENTAETMLGNFQSMQEKGLITIEDAVIASRGVGQNVEIRQTQSVTGKYTLRGSGIGLLAGFLLGGPVGGLIGGTAIGAMSGALKDIGIDDKFIREASEALGPNSSALFLLGSAQDPDGFREELKPFKATVAMTTLSPEQEKRLKATLADEE